VLPKYPELQDPPLIKLRCDQEIPYLVDPDERRR
jgi:hypothetical protein